MCKHTMPAVCGVLLVALGGCSKQRQTAIPTPPAAPAPAPSAAPAPVTVPPKPLRRVPTTQPRPATAAAAALEPLTSPEQRSTWSAEIQASVGKAEQNAAALRGRNLSDDEKRELGRVESFIRQAREAERAHDFMTARTLAERAQVLSEDLLQR